MSHDLDIEKHPEEWSKELAEAVENYKNGKRRSKRKLRKFVNSEINQYYYNELVERYSSLHNINKDKKEQEIFRKIKEWFCGGLAFWVLLEGFARSLIFVLSEYGKGLAVWYLILWFLALKYASSSKEAKKRFHLLKERTSNLKRE